MSEDDRLSARPAAPRPAWSLAVTPQQARSLLRGSAARERASARILRARGHETAARRAERSACRIGLTLDEPQAVRRMQAFVRDLSRAANYQELLERALDGALSMLSADVGTVALCDPATGALRIVAQRGFSAEFLEHFAVVTDAGTAFGRAPSQSAQSVIFEVDRDPGLGAHLWIAAVSGFRAVQSTPLIDDDNRVRGIISAHFRRTHHLRRQDLQIIAWYGQLTARALAAQQSAPMVLYETAVTCHEGSADRHDAVAAVMRSCAQSLVALGAESGGAQARVYAQRAQARARRERERGSERRRRLSGDVDHVHDVGGGAPEQT